MPPWPAPCTTSPPIRTSFAPSRASPPPLAERRASAAGHRLHDGDDVTRLHRALERRQPARVLVVVEAQHVAAQRAALVEEVDAEGGVAGGQRGEGAGQRVTLDLEFHAAAGEAR